MLLLMVLMFLKLLVEVKLLTSCGLIEMMLIEKGLT